jgi:transglutaminase-like putative cysteine protease
VVNHLVVDRYPSPLAVISIDNPCSSLPIVYSRADRAILEPFIAPAEGDDGPRYRDWLTSLAPRTDEPAVEFLRRINSAIHADFTYGARDEEGTQGPGLTVELNSGTCRDFAWLMIESVRRFGFAARFATGYLHSPGQTVRGAGATHAWCEVFLPDLGWTEFDPTNALVESSSLIRDATTRTWQESDPMNGTVIGDAECDLKVAVDVDLVEPETKGVNASGEEDRAICSEHFSDAERELVSALS